MNNTMAAPVKARREHTERTEAYGLHAVRLVTTPKKATKRHIERGPQSDASIIAVSLLFFTVIGLVLLHYVNASAHVALQSREIASIDQQIVDTSDRRAALIKSLATLTSAVNIGQEVAKLHMAQGTACAEYIDVNSSFIPQETGRREVASAF
jgi:hypothetical protein